MEKTELVKNSFMQYWFEDGILCSKYFEKIDLDLEKTKELIELRHKASNKQKQLWCYDFTKVRSFSKEGRDYANLHGQDYLHACATIVNSHTTRFIVNAFMTLKKPKVPLKAFKTKKEAINWLNEFKS